jgi:hypothetical protein
LGFRGRYKLVWVLLGVCSEWFLEHKEATEHAKKVSPEAKLVDFGILAEAMGPIGRMSQLGVMPNIEVWRRWDGQYTGRKGSYIGEGGRKGGRSMR